MSRVNVDMVLRPIKTLELTEFEFDSHGEPLLAEPEYTAVKVPGYKYPVDFGSWCYTKKKKASNNTLSPLSALRLVDPESFRLERRFVVVGYLAYLSDHLKLSKSPRSMATMVCHFRLFINWCDSNLTEALDDRANVNLALRQYAEHLYQEAQLGAISVNTAAAYQRDCHAAVVNIFDDSFSILTQGVRRLSRSQAATVVTEPPAEEDAQKMVRISFCLFDQLSDFVLQKQEFPRLIQLPHGSHWMFPTLSPFGKWPADESSATKQTRYLAYDYKSGSIRSAAEIATKISGMNHGKIQPANRVRSTAINRLAIANRDSNCERRVFFACLAAQSFVNLFGAHTGMGLGTIAQLEWSDDHEITRDSLGFKTIKPRAGDRAVTFTIGSGFLNTFKRYLKLREYLLIALGLESYTSLFFTATRGKAVPVGMDFSLHYNLRLKRLFGIGLKVTMRQWRALKSHWLIQHTDIYTTAMVLQNSPATVMKHYMAGSATQATEEISDYFRQYKQQLVIAENTHATDIPIGQCDEHLKPEALDENTLVIPDCSAPDGCLLCTKYRVHADSRDLRKLLSYMYVLESCRALAANGDHFNSMTADIFQRLERVVDEIKRSGDIDEQLYLTLYEDVFEHENLDNYWGQKLDLLTSLELL